MAKKNNVGMWKLSVLFIGILRIFTPAFIFVYPTFTAVLNILILDGFDGLAFSKANGTYNLYKIYDKLIDFWWYGFIVLYFWSRPLFLIFVILFIFRSLGQLMSIVTKKEIWLLYFPAIIEVYFIGYLIALNFSSLGFFYQGNFIYVSLILATIVALIREYVIHVTRKSLGKAILGVGPKWSK